MRVGHIFQHSNMLKNLLYFAVLTTVIVLSWIVFGIYHNITTSTISDDTSIRIIPIPANFDTATIDNLKSKEVIQADLFAGSSISTQAGIITTLPTPNPTPISTASGQITGEGL